MSNRLSLTATLNTSYAPASYSGTTGYTYDYGSTTATARRSQVTQEASSRGGSYTNTYGYDGGTTGGPGNPTSFKGITNTFNSNNQVTNTGYGYDGNGNPTTYKTAALTFDPENRLTSYGSAQTDGYSADGLRAWKQTGGSTTYFLYDGGVSVCEFNSSGTLTATNTFGKGGLVSRRTLTGTPATTFYTFDERGNVTQRTTSTGTVASTDLYDSNGSRTGTVTQPDPWGYVAQDGYYNDTETGQILCTLRFYDPYLGRFLTRDPIGYNGGINLYGYTENNPVNEDDSDGTQATLAPPVNVPTPTPTGSGGIISGVVRCLKCIGPGAAGTVGMLGGLLFGCPTKIKEDDEECRQALESLKNNVDYFGQRPWYYTQKYHGGPLDDRHNQQGQGRCSSMAKNIAKVEQCLANGDFVDPKSVYKVLGKATSVFNRICPNYGYSQIIKPSGGK